jgi:hypothetical protein
VHISQHYHDRVKLPAMHQAIWGVAGQQVSGCASALQPQHPRRKGVHDVIMLCVMTAAHQDNGHS